jgi:hypothetical protein
MPATWIGTYANGHAYGQPDRERCGLSYGPYLQPVPVPVGTYATTKRIYIGPAGGYCVPTSFDEP